MSAIDSRIRNWLVWAMPFAVIAVFIGWETDWGRALTLVPALEAPVVPKPVNVALLPEYKVDGGIDGNRETIARTLFNPTRRPAPPLAAASAKSSLQRGQFVLTGTTVVDKKATAFLREVSGGRSRRVQQGETVNGMLVAEVRADRVRLTLDGDAEELTLKVATGPRVTVQPVVTPVPGQPGQPGQPAPGQPVQPVQPRQAGVPGGAVAGSAAPVSPQPTTGAQAAGVVDAADVLANRRRAARAGANPAPRPQTN
ncbi:MAG: hypothetical protein ABW276_04545 [Casimicrobiaceae bacterium]